MGILPYLTDKFDMIQPNAPAIKTKILNRYGTLLYFSKKYNLSSYQVYRCFNAPFTKAKKNRLLEFDNLIENDLYISIKKSKAKKIIKASFKSVRLFCMYNDFSYPHVIRFLEGTITKLNPNIEVMLNHLKKESLILQDA